MNGVKGNIANMINRDEYSRGDREKEILIEQIE